MDDGFIKIIDNTDELLHEALKNGDTLATPKESQMLINMTGVSINSKPRKDGRYQGYVLDPESGKQYFYAYTREEVATKIKFYLQEAKTPKRKTKTKSSPTFGEYLDNWIKLYKEPKLKPKSLYSLHASLKPAQLAFDEKKLNTITSDDIQKLLLSISAERVRDLCRLNLNQVFTKALKQDIIKRNPCDAVEISRHKYHKKKGLTISEQNLFTEATKNSQYSLLYQMLLSTGIRIGEALALLKSDIDFEKHTVSITKNVVYIKSQRIEQNTTKSDAGNRVIPISKQLCDAIAEIDTQTIFPYSYNAVNHAIQKVAKETGLSVSAHILRHTYSDRLEEAGIPPKIKQYLLGHASLEITQNTYTDTQEDYVNAHADKIRNLFDT